MNRAKHWNLSGVLAVLAVAVGGVWQASGRPTTAAGVFDGDFLTACLIAGIGAVWAAFLRRPHDVWREHSPDRPVRRSRTARMGSRGLMLVAVLLLLPGAAAVAEAAPVAPMVADGPSPGAVVVAALAVALLAVITGTAMVIAGYVMLRCGRRRALLLAASVLLLPATVAAQPVYYCSDRLCNPGRTLLTRAMPAAPCDPWADGTFSPAATADLACFRQRYDYPFTTPGSWLGAWCSQHGRECAAVGEAFTAATGWPLVVGGACLETGEQGRRGCDAVMTAGRALGCTMLGCGVASCPGFQRTCGGSGGGDCPNGWRCTPLVEVPEGERPGATANGLPVRVTRTQPKEGGCSFFAVTQARLYVPDRPDCFEGLPADCQTVASLRPECWETSPPPPVCGDGTCDPGETTGGCPADCQDNPPPVECPAAEPLDAIRQIIEDTFGPVARRKDCLVCGEPDWPCHPSCSIGEWS